MVKYQSVDIYGCTVVFLVEPTKVEFELMFHDNVTRITDDEYKQMYRDVFQNDMCGGFTVPLDNGDYVCCIKEAEKEGYVTHELLHTAIRILWRRGFEIRDDNDEPLTYLHGWLTQCFYDWLKEEKKLEVKWQKKD